MQPVWQAGRYAGGQAGRHPGRRHAPRPLSTHLHVNVCGLLGNGVQVGAGHPKVHSNLSRRGGTVQGDAPPAM